LPYFVPLLQNRAPLAPLQAAEGRLQLCLPGRPLLSLLGPPRLRPTGLGSPRCHSLAPCRALSTGQRWQRVKEQKVLGDTGASSLIHSHCTFVARHMENRPFPPPDVPRCPQRGAACPCQCRSSGARRLQARSARDAGNRPGLCTRAALLPLLRSSTTGAALELAGRRAVYVSCCKQRGLLLLAY